MRRVKPVHPGLKNERLFLQKERTDTARRLESDECDNGLQEGGGGGESRKGTASSVVDGRRGLEGGAVDAFVAGPGKRTGVFRCSHGRQSDCQAQRAPPTRASSRGTLAHPPARPPSCCERADCAGLAIILRSTSARCCATATATAGTFLLAARSCGAPGAPGRRAGRRRNAYRRKGRKCQRASEQDRAGAGAGTGAGPRCSAICGRGCA